MKGQDVWLGRHFSLTNRRQHFWLLIIANAPLRAGPMVDRFRPFFPCSNAVRWLARHRPPRTFVCASWQVPLYSRLVHSGVGRVAGWCVALVYSVLLFLSSELSFQRLHSSQNLALDNGVTFFFFLLPLCAPFDTSIVSFPPNKTRPAKVLS